MVQDECVRPCKVFIFSGRFCKRFVFNKSGGGEGGRGGKAMVFGGSYLERAEGRTLLNEKAVMI